MDTIGISVGNHHSATANYVISKHLTIILMKTNTTRPDNRPEIEYLLIESILASIPKIILTVVWFSGQNLNANSKKNQKK